MFGQTSTNRSILCALVHECIKDSEIMTANFLNNIEQNIVNKCLLKNVNYVHPINVQTVEIVHTNWLYAGKIMGPPCDPSLHDVIGLHRLITQDSIPSIHHAYISGVTYIM